MNNDEVLSQEEQKLLAKLASFLVKSTNPGGVMVRAHAMIHALPDLAETSLLTIRESARICEVSPQWIRDVRDQFIETFHLTKKPTRTNKHQ